MKGKVIKIGSATLVAGAIVGIPLTYYLLTTDNQPIASPQVTDPAPIVAPEPMEPESEPEVVPEPMEPEPVVVPELMEPEPIVVPEPIEPEPEPEPEISLKADNYSINLGSVTGGLLNPLRHSYERILDGTGGFPKVIHSTGVVFNHERIRRIRFGFEGAPGLPGVDVDRNTLRVVEIVEQPVNGVVEFVDDGKNLRYVPNVDLLQGRNATDTVSYAVRSDSEGIVKEVEARVNITLESESITDNASELSDLLRDNFGSAVDGAVRNNFRFSDDVISNDDLRLIRYFVDNEFSEDSIKVVMGISESLSPVRNVDDHSLRKLLAVEMGLYQNQAFIDSDHGVDSWPEDYSGVMQRASFVIPSLIEVIQGNKTINYDKLHLDEVFEKLGGEYTGLFSRGQNYVPFYGHVHPSDIPPDIRELIADLNNLDAVLTQEEVQGNKDRNVRLVLSAWGFTENGLRYHDAFYNPLTWFNENVINFSVLAVLDEFDYTLGKPLVDKSSDEIDYLFDLVDKTHDNNERQIERQINPLFFSEGTTGGYGVVYGWENGFMSNGERTNVYNQVRSIIGLDVDSVSDGVFGLLDWLSHNKKHAGARPYLPNFTFVSPKETEALNSLPITAFHPGVYHFIPREYGGIWFGSSKNYPGIVTGALRSLNVQSRQFNADDGYFGFGLRAPPVNIGSIVIDGKTWLYDGNFAFVPGRTCRTLLPEENFTLEKLREVDTDPEGAYDSFFYGNEEFCDLYDV